MLGWHHTFARPWQLWGGVVAGFVVIAQGLMAGDSTGRDSRAIDPVATSLEEPGGWRIGKPVAIRVEEGRATFRAPARPHGPGVLLIVSSLARGAGTFPIAIRANSVARAEDPRLESDPVATLPSTPNPVSLPPIPAAPTCEPPASRTFHLLVRDGDVASGRNYEAVDARLRAFGKRVQVYVAREDLERVSPDVLRDLVETFDEHIHPTAAANLGQAEDVDADGRFTIFLSSWLSRMGQGKQAVDGFVRVADLDRSYAAPFGNRCDMMYLSADLKAGPHLRTVVAHEYTHAVLFSRKSLGTGRTKAVDARVEEEGWLDEAIAHLSEDLHGFSRSNLDYRVSAYLSSPERYRLVVDDYYSANLFRSHGNRGSTYLFLRWCADQYGPDLVPALIGSSRTGLANLESVTGESFASLYRRWTIALAAAALGPESLSAEYKTGGFRSIDLRGTIEQRWLAGPRVERLLPGRGGLSWEAPGTTSRYVLIDGGESDAVEVDVTAPETSELQVTAIPLANNLPRLDLKSHFGYDAKGDLNLYLSIRGDGQLPIRLIGIAWEPLIPPVDPRSGRFPCGKFVEEDLRGQFGVWTLVDGTRRQRQSITLKGIGRESGPYLVKVLGRDAEGRLVSAWIDVNVAPVRSDQVAQSRNEMSRLSEESD